MVEKKSASGMAIHTPVRPKIYGRTRRRGMRKITCLDRVSITEIFAIPIESASNTAEA